MSVLKQKAELSQRGRAMLLVVKILLLLKIVQGHSKLHRRVART